MPNVLRVALRVVPAELPYDADRLAGYEEIRQAEEQFGSRAHGGSAGYGNGVPRRDDVAHAVQGGDAIDSSGPGNGPPPPFRLVTWANSAAIGVVGHANNADDVMAAFDYLQSSAVSRASQAAGDKADASEVPAAQQ
ncbi:hypothetical protein ACJ41O_013265 [Fusarium nematophilum]